MPPAIVSIVSKKRAGKTTLMEKVIPLLKAGGCRVGTVKHDMHGFDMDHEGKDTWRHKKCGAEAVVISSPWKLSLICDVPREMDLDEIVSRYFEGFDLVLTEGYLRAGKPQIEVFRSAAHRRPLYEAGSTGPLVAVASDVPLDLGVPWFHLDDARGIADFIETRFLRPAPSGNPWAGSGDSD